MTVASKEISSRENPLIKGKIIMIDKEDIRTVLVTLIEAKKVEEVKARKVEEVKAEDDEGEEEDDDHDDVQDDADESDADSMQEELLDEVSALAHDGVTKETERLVQKALQSVEIKDITKLTPAS